MITTPRLSIALAAALAALGTAATAHASPASGTPPRLATGRGARTAQRAFVRLELKPDPAGRSLVVGQAVPATVHAYFLAGTGVTLNGAPRVVSDGFLLSELSDKPRQSETEIRGLPYTQLTWTAILTAVKAGAADPTIELPTELAYREASAPAKPAGGGDDSSGDDDDANPFASLLKQTPFASDPFFAQAFKNGDPFGHLMDLGGEVHEREVTLRDQARNVEVTTLPGDRPADYQGAVGKFEATAALSSHSLRVGEPATFTLRVQGRGSFDRLSSAGLPSSDALTTYAVKSDLTRGPGPIEGQKVFMQTIVPRRPGALTIPSVSITTFDPQKRRYVVRQTAPIAATVEPAADGQATAATATPTTPGAVTTQAPRVAAVSDAPHATLVPAFRTARYWSLAGAIFVVAALLSVLGLARTRGEVQRLVSRRRTKRAIAANRRRMEAAVAQGDARALFSAARAALQARLGVSWQVPPEAISTADIEARLGERGAQVREIFQRADRLTYAGTARPDPHEDLARWSRVVSGQLSSLEKTA